MCNKLLRCMGSHFITDLLSSEYKMRTMKTMNGIFTHAKLSIWATAPTSHFS